MIKIEKLNGLYIASVILNDIKIEVSGNTENEAINNCKDMVLEYLNPIETPISKWIKKGYWKVLEYSDLEDCPKVRNILTEAFLHTMPPKLTFGDFVKINGNYKLHNTYGDAILSVAIIEYLKRKGSSNISADKADIASRQNVGKVMINSGFNKYVISENDLSNNVKIQGEILEAWIGAVADIDRDKGINLAKKIFKF